MKKIKLLFSILFLVATSAFAQYGHRLYFIDSTSNEVFNDGAVSRYVTISGKPATVAAGTVNTFSASGASFSRGRFMQCDYSGNTSSNLKYTIYNVVNGTTIEYPVRLNSLCDQTTKTFTLSGRVETSTNLGDVLFLKTSSAGVISSARAIEIGGDDEALCTRQTRATNGAFYTCGTTKASGTTTPRAFIMSHNSDGSTINWLKIIANLPCPAGAIGNAEATAVIDETNTGNVIVVGNVSSGTCQNAFIAKFSSVGALLWLNLLGASTASNFNLQNIRATDVSQEFVITGEGTNPTTGRRSILLARINTSGASASFLWSRLISSNGSATSVINSQRGNDVVMRKTSAGAISYYVAGVSNYTSGTSDGMLLRTDATGLPVYIKEYAGTNNESYNAIDMYYSTGAIGEGVSAFGSYDYRNTSTTATTVKRSWYSKTYFNLASGCNELADAATNIQFSMTPTAFTPGLSGTWIPNTFRYSSVPELNLILCWSSSIASGSNLRLSQSDLNESMLVSKNAKIYPNPSSFSNDVTLSIYSETEDVATVRVFDGMGRICLSREFAVIQGSNEANLSIKTLSSGCYFVYINTLKGNAQKLRLIKN